MSAVIISISGFIRFSGKWPPSEPVTISRRRAHHDQAGFRVNRRLRGVSGGRYGAGAPLAFGRVRHQDGRYRDGRAHQGRLYEPAWRDASRREERRWLDDGMDDDDGLGERARGPRHQQERTERRERRRHGHDQILRGAQRRSARLHPLDHAGRQARDPNLQRRQQRLEPDSRGTTMAFPRWAGLLAASVALVLAANAPLTASAQGGFPPPAPPPATPAGGAQEPEEVLVKCVQ